AVDRYIPSRDARRTPDNKVRPEKFRNGSPSADGTAISRRPDRERAPEPIEISMSILFPRNFGCFSIFVREATHLGFRCSLHDENKPRQSPSSPDSFLPRRVHSISCGGRSGPARERKGKISSPVQNA